MTLKITNNVSKNLIPWPQADVLNEMMDVDFAGLISALQVDTVLAGHLDVGLGNSETIVSIYGKIEQGEEGLEQLKTMANTFADGIRSSLNQMSGNYKKLFEKILADFDENGFVMPHVGRLI